MALTNIITACCVCDKIRINDEADLWLSKSENSNLYDKLVKGKELSHGYCPEHYEQAMKEARKI